MTDETQEQRKKDGTAVFGVSAQVLGGSICYLYVKSEARKGNYWEAGDESNLGVLFGVATYIAYKTGMWLFWLVRPRVLKWRKG